MGKFTDTKTLHNRINRLVGQIQAIDRMIDEDAKCEDILSLISAAKSALNKVGQIILERHITHCVRDAVRSGHDDGLEDFAKAIERFANMQ